MLLSNKNNDQLKKLEETIKNCDQRIVIVSPYLAKDLDSFLANFDFSLANRVDLVTTFKPRDTEQVTKPFQIRKYFQHFSSNYPNLSARVSIDNQLHGKLYFAIGSGGKSLILTSANFTSNGLKKNNEWGFLITDEEVVERALEEVFDEVSYSEVTQYQIERACQFAEVYLKNHPEWTEKHDIAPDILEEVYADSDLNNLNVKYFLKPIGDSESPITLQNETDFAELHQNLHFSTKKPQGVRKGDILITVAVGAGALLGYFKVTSGLQYASSEQLANNAWMSRWPWYVEGRNNSRDFSAEWSRHNLKRQDLLTEFREMHPGEPITYAGGDSLGTLNFGNDKVRLSETFAKYLIQRIEAQQKAV